MQDPAESDKTVQSDDEFVIPESGKWEGSPQCVMEMSGPFEVDGKMVRTIVSRHSDGFVCLRFEDVDQNAPAVESGDDDPMKF